MPQAVLQEWRDSNQSRSYPFAEDASLISEESSRLANDVFIDAIFYPANLTNLLFVSEISRTENIVRVTDSGTGKVKGQAEISGGEVLDFRDAEDRHVGKLVKGPGFNLLVGDNTYTVEATPLAPSCVFPQNQVGVKSIKLPDGSMLTGNIKFEGVDGIRLRVENDTIAIHAVGVAEVPDGIALPPPIKQIFISEGADSRLTLGRDDNVLKVGHRLSLEELDSTKDKLVGPGGVLPPREDSKFGTDVFDPCLPLPPDEPCGPFPATPPGTQIVDHDGYFYIVSVSDLINISPATVFNIPTVIQGIDPEVVDLIVRSLPPRDQQGLKINVKDCRF
jgi:hypothetical protein